MKKRISLILTALLTVSTVFSVGINLNAATVSSKATLLKFGLCKSINYE